MIYPINPSLFNQFKILTVRRIRIFLNNRLSQFLLLLFPLLIGLIGLISLSGNVSEPFDFQNGDPFAAVTGLFILVISVFFSGFITQLPEISKEQKIHLHDRSLGLNWMAYLFSKLFFATSNAIYQAVVLTIIFQLVLKIPGGVAERMTIFWTVFILMMSAMVLGLIVSIVTKSIYSNIGIGLVVFILNILFSGIFVSLPQPVLNIFPTYLAFKNLIMISGIGSDITSDACWYFPDEIRAAMTLEDKSYFECKCLGTSVFTQASCNFPGTGKYFTQEINIPEPTPPLPPGSPPEPPVLPSSPPIPKNPNDELANKQYQQSLQEYNQEVDKKNKEYQLQITSHNLRLEFYRSQYETFESEHQNWHDSRIDAVKLAENNIAAIFKKFHWVFIDINDTRLYQMELVKNWGAQAAILITLWIILAIMIKRMDRKLEI